MAEANRMTADSLIAFPNKDLFDYFAHLEETLDCLVSSPREPVTSSNERSEEIRLVVKPILALSYDQFIHPSI